MDERQISKWLQDRKDRKENLSVEKIFDGITDGSIAMLSSGITLIESTRQADQLLGHNLINRCLPLSGKSIRIGITGVPGVGKSTFIEAFGKELLLVGKKLAVLTIDPSSSTSGGSILGDKTRMEQLSKNGNVFIRPSPAGDTLGGVARKTRESIILCEAAGFDVILVETVGVGQSETLVHSMVDFFLLLMLSGAGDELQGIKRGIMEMADALIITKADGENQLKAKIAEGNYKNAMHLFPAKNSGWIPTTGICSAYENFRIAEIWKTIESFENLVKINGYLKSNRLEQDVFWLKEAIKELLVDGFYNNDSLRSNYSLAKQNVLTGNESAFLAAEKLYNEYLKLIRDGRI